VIGANFKKVGSNLQQGTVYIFTRSGVAWNQQQELTVSDGAARDVFGWSVAVSGDTAVIGAPDKVIGSNPYQGAAYVFVRGGATWTLQQELAATDAAADDRFGYSVALNADTAVIGAWQKSIGSNANQGAAYVFVRSGVSWAQLQELTAADGAPSDQFGDSVAVSGDTVVGAYQELIGYNRYQGAAYVFV
jgi:hypothetical protein